MRNFILISIDIIRQFLFNYRRLIAFSIEECPKNKDIITNDFYPYDLVMPVTCIQNPKLFAIDSSHYNFGVVVGFDSKLSSSKFDKIKVAHFNMAEFGVPLIKSYNVTELALLATPISTLKDLYNTIVSMGVNIDEEKINKNEGSKRSGGGRGNGGDEGGGGFTIH